MSSIVSPPKPPFGTPQSQEREPALREAAGADILVPHILLQLEDDLERSHRREAAWISVAVHLFAVIFLLLSPKLFPGIRGVVIANPADLMHDKQLTYLDMPPDEQTPPKQVKPDAKLSDKNRIAESRHPQLDQKTIEELRKAGPPKPPHRRHSPPRGRRRRLRKASRRRRNRRSRRTICHPRYRIRSLRYRNRSNRTRNRPLIFVR